MSTTIFLCRRTLFSIGAILLVIVGSFFLLHATPGDPAILLAGEGASPELIARVRQELGLEAPVYVQLFRYLVRVARGDLGYSYTFREPVITLILERLVPTMYLSGASLAFAFIGGVALGLISGSRPNTLVDRVISIASVIGYSLPVFWLGQLAIIVFSVQMGVLPSSGYRSLRDDYSGLALFADFVSHLVLPALTLGLVRLGVVARLMRAAVIEERGKEYVRTARAKGQTEVGVFTRHVLRNAMLPVVTLFGLSLPIVFSGAVLTETVFGWPGLGRLMTESLFRRDYPVILGMFVFVTVGLVITDAIVDVLYTFSDPRIRYS